MIEYEATRAGFTPAIAVKIARCESSLNPKAKNPSGSDAGLFQLTDSFRARYCPAIDPFDPVENTRCAVKVMARPAGLNRWYPSFNCWKNL